MLTCGTAACHGEYESFNLGSLSSPAGKSASEPFGETWGDVGQYPELKGGQQERRGGTSVRECGDWTKDEVLTWKRGDFDEILGRDSSL